MERGRTLYNHILFLFLVSKSCAIRCHVHIHKRNTTYPLIFHPLRHLHFPSLTQLKVAAILAKPAIRQWLREDAAIQ
jgi:hypothetical protein